MNLARALRSYGWVVGAIAIVIAGLYWVGSVPGFQRVDLAENPVFEGAEVKTAVEWIEAFNSSDFERLASLMVLPDSPDRGLERAWLFEGELRFVEELRLNANEQMIAVDQCRLANRDPSIVECPVTVSDDFWSVAGLNGRETTLTLFYDDLLRVVSYQSGFPDLSGADHVAFHLAFNAWLTDTHPVAAESITPAAANWAPGVGGDPAAMSRALDYVDEFLAQSDVYPLDG